MQNWHRDYNAGLGRYAETDPIGLSSGINLYKYGYGDPVGITDAAGLDPKYDILRCHVCPHNDPVENAIGGLIVAGPAIAVLGNAALTSGVSIRLQMEIIGSPTALTAMKFLGEGVSGTSCGWPGPGNGSKVINGIKYTDHALQRMSPMIRNIPPSVVKNALEYGNKTFNKMDPDIIYYEFQNIFVITTEHGSKVISVIKKGN